MVEYFIPDADATLGDIKLAQFKPTQAIFSLGQDIPVVWVRMTVKNHSDEQLQLFLNHNFAYISKKIDIYEFQDNKKIKSQSYNLVKPTPHNLLAGSSIIYGFELNENQQKVFYIKNHTFTFQLFNFSVGTLNNTLDDLASKNSVAYFICYFLLSLAFYNLMLFLLSKRNEYFFYSLYLSNAGLGLMYLYGLLSSDFGFYGKKHQWFVLTSILVPLFLSLFVQSVFDTKKQHKRAHIALNFVSFLSISGVLIALFIDLHFAVLLMPAPFTASFLIMVYVVYVFYKRKHPLVKIFVVSYLLYLVGMLATMLSLMNAGLPFNGFTYYGSGFSIVIEAILFSYLLYYRIKILEKDVFNQRNSIVLQSKKNQMGDMISAISHQWKQPLTAISSAITLLQFKLDNKVDIKAAELKTLVSGVNEKVLFMAETINDFRAFFQSDGNTKEVDISDVIQRVIVLINDDLLAGNVIVKTELNFSRKINTLHNELLHIIINVMQNALDAFNNKEIKTKELIIRGSNTSDTWMFEIEDNAGGIDKELLPDIFQEHFTTKEQKEGSGIGLYLSKFILEKHLKGTITAENKSNGALFKITLKELKNE